MFSRKFEENHKREYTTHEFATFYGEKTEQETVEYIMKEGVATYMKKRGIYLNINVSCCSGTKIGTQWYLFPIHIDSLANVGLTEQELIQWLNFLNSSKAGFKYYYFGEQTPDKDNIERIINGRGTKYYSSDNFYWVGVPRFYKDNEPHNPFLSYLHWIALRYLVSTITHPVYTKADRKYTDYIAPRYYNIPRVAIMLHEDYKVPRLRAFLFAHLTAPYHGYKALFDMGLIWTGMDARLPDVGILTAEFRKIWKTPTQGNMNFVFTPQNSSNNKCIKDIRDMRATYTPMIAAKLFADGKYKEFIKYLKDSYKLKTSKKNAKEKVVA